MRSLACQCGGGPSILDSRVAGDQLCSNLGILMIWKPATQKTSRVAGVLCVVI